MMANELMKGYVDSALEQLRRQHLMSWSGKLPEAMRDPAIAPSRDWVGWKPIASTVTDADLDSLERETALSFPPPYRDFLKYLHFVSLTETGVRFEPHLCDGWLDTLRRVYFKSWPRERILDVGLLPFANESLMDAGPVCFDTRSPLADGDCPVVFWDHGWKGTEREIRPMFSCSAKMFECLILVAQTDINFVYHDTSDDPAVLPKKQQFLQCFLAIDPSGAGGPGRSYWTCWGVTPVA